MKEIRNVKHVCAVPGCGSIHTVAFSRGSGGSVCLCGDCIRELYRKTVNDAQTNDKKQQKKQRKGAGE